MKKVFLATIMACLCLLTNAQTWSEPAVPGSDLNSLSSSEIVYFYNVDADAFVINGLSWNTQACATRLANGDQRTAEAQQAYAFVQDGKVKIRMKRYSSNFISCGTADANNVYVDQNNNPDFSYTETAAGSHVYTLKNTTHAAFLDVTWTYGGHLTLAGGGGHTKWAFIPETAITNGSYALYKAKKQLYGLYKAICNEGKETAYSKVLNKAYVAYTDKDATVATITNASKTLFSEIYAELTQPVNVSFLFINSDMAGSGSVEGWLNGSCLFNYGVFETYHSSLTLAQSQTVPQGIYDVVLHALYREDATTGSAPTLNLKATNTVSAKIPAVSSINYNVGNTENNNWTAGSNGNEPNGMQSSAQAHAHQDAVTRASGAIVGTDGALRISLNMTSAEQWLTWQGVEIFYQGIGSGSVNAELGITITEAENHYGDGSEKGAADLKDAIDKAKEIYQNENATVQSIMEVNSELKTAITTFLEVSASIEKPLERFELINNYNFEYGFDNWEQQNMATQSNTAFGYKSGNVYVEKWIDKGYSVGDAYVGQKVNNLPLGIWILKAAAQNIQEGVAGTQSNAWIFANNSTAAVSTAGEYSLVFTNIEDNALVGFKAVGATGNWLSCDNFRLYYAGGEFADFKAELQNYVNKAKSYVSKKIETSVLATLQSAIAAAEAELLKTSADGYPTVSQPLRLATEAAETSFRAFAQLQEAIDAAEGIYGNGDKDGSDKFLTVINNAKSVNENLESSQAQMAEEIAKLEKATFEFRLANGSGTVPTVVTDPRYARGSIAAFGRMTVSGVSTANILEQGFCWSTEPNPTVLDNRTTQYLENNGRIYVMNTEPATLYYIRAYAITKDYAVGYGDVIRISTLPKGNVTYWYNNGGDEAQNNKNNTALTIATTYWSNYTSIRGFNVSCTFSPGTPTADCGYGGGMRIGTNMGQRAGTCMHEMNHGIGGGTLEIWGGWSKSPLRKTINGEWAGDRANEVVRFWENRNDLVITGAYDGAHWGVVAKGETYSSDNIFHNKYPHNGAHLEPGAWAGPKNPNDTEIFYIGNSLINQGFCEDGLIPVNFYSGAFCLPAYVFEHEDNKKYYIKNESTERGLYSSYLIEGLNKKIQWVEASAEDVALNDSAAWYISFNPELQYYQFKNVATGRYLSYSTTGLNGIKMVDKSAPTLNENFHLMKGRVNVVVGKGNKRTTTRGFWVIHPENKSNPDCLVANASKRTAAATLDLYDEAAYQRWIFMDADEIQTFEESTKTVYAEELRLLIKDIREMATTPHVEEVGGVDDNLETKLIEIEGKVESVTTANGIQILIEEARAACIEFLAEATPTNLNQPFEISFLANNASIEDNSGWSVAPTFSYSCAEFFETTFDFNQRLQGMPGGTYKIKAQAFQRPGDYTTAYNDYTAGTDKTSAMLYVGTLTKNIKHIAADAKSSKLSSQDVSVGSPAVYIPNTMYSASLFFNKDLYDNEVVTSLSKDNSNLRFGIKSTSYATGYWTVLDNFRIYFYGSWTVDNVLTDIKDVRQDEESDFNDSDVYNLHGIKVGTSLEGLPRGIYIVNKKKVFVK